MKDLTAIKHLLEKVWTPPLCTDLLSKKIDVSNYKELSKQIPDQFLLIEEIFPKDELEEIWGDFESYLDEYKIFPFMGTLGETVICIGYGESNKGKIFYFDFDFGCFPLSDDSLDDFMEKLIES